MFCAILMATNSSFQKGMIFCRSIYVKKVMKLLAFIFEQPSYCINPSYSYRPLINTTYKPISLNVFSPLSSVSKQRLTSNTTFIGQFHEI